MGERYTAKKEALPGSVSEIVTDMKSVADTMAAMHEKGLAHGDITLGGLRLIDGRLGPGIPERFSKVEGGAGPNMLGEKRFIFYNNAWHAPELRFPETTDKKNVWSEPERRFPRESIKNEKVFKSWQYTPVSKEGDIWSFGVLLAVMICRIPGGKERLEEAGVLQLSLSEHMVASGLYHFGKCDEACHKFLSDKRRLLELNLPKNNWLPIQVNTSIPVEDKEKFDQLVTLIGSCTHPDPEKRPSAERLQKALVHKC